MELLETESYRNATMIDICYVCNGCGPKSWKYKIDKILGINLFEACNRHDWDYNEGGDKALKREADLRFILNIIIILLEARSYWNILRVPAAMMFYVAVHFCGKTSFNWKEKGDG